MSAPAGGGAREQVARLLALVPLLHSRGNLRISEAAAALGVPERQVSADLRVLFMCGRPGGLPDDLIDVDLDGLSADGVIRVTNAEYLQRPLRLTPTEATALIVALRAVRAGATLDTAELIDRVLAKLETAAAAGPQQLEIGAEDSVAPVRALLEEACRDGRQVRLSYYVPGRDEEAERVVDPHQVFVREEQPYLRGWCHRADAPRVFRLDRIHDCSVLSAPVTTAAEAESDEASGWFHDVPDALSVVLHLAPPARWVPEYFPVVAQGELGDGRLAVTMTVVDRRWLERLLLRLAPHARAVSPEGLHEEFTELARRTVNLYDLPDVH